MRPGTKDFGRHLNSFEAQQIWTALTQRTMRSVYRAIRRSLFANSSAFEMRWRSNTTRTNSAPVGLSRCVTSPLFLALSVIVLAEEARAAAEVRFREIQESYAILVKYAVQKDKPDRDSDPAPAEPAPPKKSSPPPASSKSTATKSSGSSKTASGSAATNNKKNAAPPASSNKQKQKTGKA